MKEDKTKSFNMDCLEFMTTVPDKFYDLAIVDPPYGIDRNNMNMGNSVFNKDNKKWDSSIPDLGYFKELFRISKKSNYLGR
jgi:site-specific DNA-methyltransferase (adenine-specific)